jgi:predicted dinucleotide-binding enzyme
MSEKWKIAVLGAGKVGGALGRLWSAKGHDVVYGVPDPQSPKLAGKRAATNEQAAAGAHVIALCVPWASAEAALQACGDLDGKIVIDATNPLAPGLTGLTVGTQTSAAEMVAGWARGAQVVKAFNTIGAIRFGDAQFGGQRADGYYCGGDAAAKEIVKGLVEDAGLDPVDVGPLTNARYLEPLAMLWIDLAVNQRQGPNHAFKLLRR